MKVNTGKTCFLALAAFLLIFPGYIFPGDLAVTAVSLAGDWEFRQSGRDTWYPAVVPGCAHTDLLANKLISDPYYRDNLDKSQWIEEQSWEYRKQFEADSGLLNNEHIELVFPGLDTYASVSLNGLPLGDTDNMFREYRFNIKPALKPGANELKVLFKFLIQSSPEAKYKLPSLTAGASPHTRKALYQFGSDFSPRLLSCGIWQPVYIECWNKARIQDMEISQQFPEKNKAVLGFKIDLLSDAAAPAELRVSVSGGKSFSRSQQVNLVKGGNKSEFSLEIPSPELWWPAGLGRQKLYTVKAQLYLGGRAVDSRSQRVGLRTLSLEQKDDKWGQSFRFTVNGLPFFARGANWVPADMFPCRVSGEKYRALLREN